MDLNAIMAKDSRDWTSEEFAFVEQELLRCTRQLYDELSQISEQVQAEQPEVAAKLEAAAASMLANVEAGVAAPD
jgi:hypothetical protein